MLTRCPHCTTTFRVKPEQLKARLGRVRCGQCQTVFNALDSLVEEVPVVPVAPVMSELAVEPTVLEPSSATADVSEQMPPAEEATVPQPVHEVETLVEMPEVATAANDESSAPIEDLPEHSESESQPVPVVEEMPPLPAEQEPELAESIAPAPEPAVTELHAEPEPATAQSEEPAATTPSQELPETQNEGALSVEAADAEALDFTITDVLAPAATATEPLVPEPAATETPASPAEAPATQVLAEPKPDPDPEPQPPRPTRRWPWAVLATIASLLLIGQALFQYRVEVAVFAPALKPLLKAACEPLGCDVPRPRQAELLDIESSDLHPGKAKGRLELVAVLKNKAPFAQELPVVELSLTDTADRPLIIKALQPADYLPPGRKPTAGFPAKGEINVNLTLDAGDVPATGYRLYLYYP